MDKQYKALLDMTDHQAANVLRKMLNAMETRGNGKSYTYAAFTIALTKAIEALEKQDA